MCANKLKLWIYIQVEKLMYMEPVINLRTKKYDTLIREFSPVTTPCRSVITYEV